MTTVSSRRLVLGTLLGPVCATALLGCGPDAEPAAESGQPTECLITSAPAVELTGPLAAFDLTGVARPIHTVEENGFFVINAVAQKDISTLAIDFVEVVQDAGFDIAGSDNEGFEAEVFFASGRVAAGQVVLTESTCPGVVDVKITVLDDPAVLPEDESSGAPQVTTSTPST